MAAPRSKWTQKDYDRAAEEYLATLPLEHFMEATTQSILLPIPAEMQQQMDQQRERIRELEKQAAYVVPALRPLVETRARLAGRQDILEQLPAVADAQRLTQWLVELG